MIKYMLILIFSVSCNLLEKDRSASAELKKVKKDYYSYLNKTCVEDKYYEGLRNTFQYSACLLDEKIVAFQLNMNRFSYMWTDAEYYQNKEEIEKEMSRSTKIFLSFFSPDPKLVDLHEKDTEWKIYLSDGDKRYEAKSVIRLPNEFERIKNLYPIHSKWSQAYEVSFPVSLNMLKRGQLEFTLTSREGMSKKVLSSDNWD